MSCWKCEKELPPGETDCEDGCQPQKLPTFGELANDFDSLRLTIEIYFDLKKLQAAPEQHREAVQKFSFLLGELLAQSGLDKFLKTKP